MIGEDREDRGEGAQHQCQLGAEAGEDSARKAERGESAEEGEREGDDAGGVLVHGAAHDGSPRQCVIQALGAGAASGNRSPLAGGGANTTRSATKPTGRWARPRVAGRRAPFRAGAGARPEPEPTSPASWSCTTSAWARTWATEPGNSNSAERRRRARAKRACIAGRTGSRMPRRRAKWL